MGARVELFDDLDAVARDAAGRLDRAAQPCLFDRLDWFRLTLAHCPPPGRLLVARAGAGEAAAWLFLMVAGRRAEALASWYSLRVGAPARGVASPELLAAIGARLRRERLSRLALAPIEPARADAMRAGLAAAGWRVRDEPATANWSVATAGMAFDAYWRGRPSRLRSTARRKAAGLEIEIVASFSDDTWCSYETVYAASWKPAEGSPAFLRALARQEGAAGTLRMGIARAGGQPVAAQLWLVENGVATIHKLAHAASADTLSPGTVLTAAMVRHVLTHDRPARIDFGTGDDAYKADWMDERVMLRRLVAFNPSTADGLAGAARGWAAALVRGGSSG